MAKTMRAVKLAGPRNLELVETESPEPDGQRVLIAVSHAGICGTDLHFWEAGEGSLGAKDLIMGHEFTGTVEDPGARSDSLRKGDRVAVFPLDPCGQCPACKKNLPGLCPNVAVGPGVGAPGGFAEYFLARPDMVRKLPESVSELEAAMLEPSCVALHAMHLAETKPGDKVLVVGGGIIGLLCAAWARIAGAVCVILTETNPLRRAQAEKVCDLEGVLDANDPELDARLMNLSEGGFDQALDCSGSGPGINTAIMALKSEGRLILVGVNQEPLSINTFFICLKELCVKGDMGYTTAEFDQAIEMTARKKIQTEQYVSDVIVLEKAQTAFERLTSGEHPDVKIIIRPDMT